MIGLALACALDLGLVASAFSQTPTPVGPQNWAMGRATAPVTLIEYGSLTCGHCAEFNNSVLPAIKRNYIDTGRVRYVFRPFPTPPNDLSVAMHALTLCAGPTRYYQLSDAFFTRQAEIFDAARGETGPKGTIFAIAEDHGGLSYSQSEACLRDPARQAQVQASALAGDAAGVSSTPTFFVNGVRVNVPLGQHVDESLLAAAIAAALRVPSPKRAPAPKAKKR
jgi:protein-disulfide isomerase